MCSFRRSLFWLGSNSAPQRRALPKSSTYTLQTKSLWSGRREPAVGWGVVPSKADASSPAPGHALPASAGQSSPECCGRPVLCVALPSLTLPHMNSSHLAPRLTQASVPGHGNPLEAVSWDRCRVHPISPHLSGVTVPCHLASSLTSCCFMLFVCLILFWVLVVSGGRVNSPSQLEGAVS